MPTYCIGYDLKRPHQDYEGLIKAIKALGNWWHCLDSTWLVVSNRTAVEIRDNLIKHLDGNDEMLVSPVGSNWASYGLGKECNDWLHRNWVG